MAQRVADDAEEFRHSIILPNWRMVGYTDSVLSTAKFGQDKPRKLLWDSL